MKKFKTLELFKHYETLLEQDQMEVDPAAQEASVDPNTGIPTDPSAQAPAPQAAPLSSEAENQYISDLVDAALFQPTSEEAKSLLNLQNIMKTKSYTNPREEVLPLVLSHIRPETSSDELKDSLDKV